MKKLTEKPTILSIVAKREGLGSGGELRCHISSGAFGLNERVWERTVWLDGLVRPWRVIIIHWYCILVVLETYKYEFLNLFTNSVIFSVIFNILFWAKKRLLGSVSISLISTLIIIIFESILNPPSAFYLWYINFYYSP